MTKRSGAHPARRERIYNRANGKCELCDKHLQAQWYQPPFNPRLHTRRQPIQFTVTNGVFHHKVPLWKGGEDNNDSNYQLLCVPCHRNLHRSTPSEVCLEILASCRRATA